MTINTERYRGGVERRPCVLGIDLGGTYLRMGIATPAGDLLSFDRQRVSHSLRGAELVDLIHQHAQGSPFFANVTQVGISLAGAILADGVLKPEMLNLPSLGGFPLAQSVAGRFGLPCLIGNDANLALLGEAHFGAARGFRNVLLLTLGTGIGGGLMLNGQLWNGSHSSGVELGLTMIGDPVKGEVYPIESCFSPGAMMAKLDEKDGTLFEQVAAGSNVAISLSEGMFKALGLLITNVHLLLDLEKVILSGGLIEAGDVVRRGIQAAFDALCPPQYNFDLSIDAGELPPHTVGVLGAACMCFEHSGELSPLPQSLVS